MRQIYCQLDSEDEIKESLNELDIDIFEPSSRKEETMAEALDAFSSFVLHEERVKCKKIVEDDIGSSVGELQGGSDDYNIYRVSIPDEEDCNDAAVKLIKEFHCSQQGIQYANTLTIEKLKTYMLGMCDRRTRKRGCRKYTELGNLMFILQFGGPTEGQVRHIDNMLPNVQICLYMSSECPSTIVYAMDGPPITNGATLIDFWGRNDNEDANSSNEMKQVVPELIKCIFEEWGDVILKTKWHTKYFAFWGTINSHLNCFGKLYQPVSLQLSLQTDPGTTLLAGGNEVHAGPPTNSSRMFAFAIGIPEEDIQEEKNDEDNDGEIQYSPVLLHIDFCCILFSILDYEFTARLSEFGDDAIVKAKYFLLNVLRALLVDYPTKIYLRQIDDDRNTIRKWLDALLMSIQSAQWDDTSRLIEDAVHSDSIFYSPDVYKKRAKKKKRRKHK